jgi:hypothetical protein
MPVRAMMYDTTVYGAMFSCGWFCPTGATEPADMAVDALAA